MSYTEVVSQVAPLGFADLAGAADELPGQEFTDGRDRLVVHGPVGPGFAGALRFAGTLRTQSPLLPRVKVEVVVSPWSAGRSEVAIHPLTHLGRFDSRRANRFYKAASSVLALVIDRLEARIPQQAPAVAALAA